MNLHPEQREVNETATTETRPSAIKLHLFLNNPKVLLLHLRVLTQCFSGQN